MIKNKSNYLLPYFFIKLINSIITTINTLDFLLSDPNSKIWIETINSFPHSEKLMKEDQQKLKSRLFVILLLVWLLKVNSI